MGNRFNAGGLVDGACPYLQHREELSARIKAVLDLHWRRGEFAVKLECPAPYKQDSDDDPMSFVDDDVRHLMKVAIAAGISDRPLAGETP